MTNLISIYMGGILTLLLAALHSQYYRIFNWKSNFQSISPLNVRIFYTIHMALLLIFIGVGALSLIFAQELSRSIGLAFGFNLTLSVFWFWRIVWQLLYFKREKGKKNPFLARILILWFILLFIAYIIPVISRLV